MVSVYDINNSGKLEIAEFVTWMMLQYVKVRVRQRAQDQHMVLTYSPLKSDTADKEVFIQ